MGVYRSFLFAPGNHPRKVEKVFGVGSDAVILDLEDAVANDEKIATREAVVAALQRPRRNLGYVRINGFDTEFVSATWKRSSARASMESCCRWSRTPRSCSRSIGW